MNSTKDWLILDLWFRKDNVLTDICCLITGMWAPLTEFMHGGNFFFFFLQIFHGTIIETDISYFYLNEDPVSTPVWLVLLLFSFFWEW